MTASGDTRISGVGYAPEGRVEHGGAELAAGPLQDEARVVLSGGSLAGNADLRQAASGAWEIHGDPTEAAFLVAEGKLGQGTVTERRERRFERVGEIPFTCPSASCWRRSNATMSMATRWWRSPKAVPFLNIAFGTAPLSLDQWLVCAAIASGVLFYSELRKVVSRIRGR